MNHIQTNDHCERFVRMCREKSSDQIFQRKARHVWVDVHDCRRGTSCMLVFKVDFHTSSSDKHIK